MDEETRMTELTDIIKSRIAEAGPISVGEYMHVCLGHPEHGYYTNRDPFGPDGDFVTAPEVSQMFGEMVALWLMQTWVDQGRPERFILAELGPGRGTLMADMLRTAETLPDFRAAAEVWLVENSPAMRRKQSAVLMGQDPHWAFHVDELPDAPLFLVANEFFDALPMHQFRKNDSGWQERLITVKDNKLEFTHSRPAQNSDLDEFFPMLPEHLYAEVSFQSEEVAAKIGDRIATRGGAAFIIDYGDWDGAGDSLQAVQKHEHIDALDHPHGDADVTAHVNFAALARAAGAARTEGCVPQGPFLKRIGIDTRAEMLTNATDIDDVAEEIAAALHRLTDASEMGTLFKVMGLVHRDAPTAPGFEDASLIPK